MKVYYKYATAILKHSVSGSFFNHEKNKVSQIFKKKDI